MRDVLPKSIGHDTAQLVRNSLLQAPRCCEPDRHSHGNSPSEQHSAEMRALCPFVFPGSDNFLKMPRPRDHYKNMLQKAHRGQFEAPAVVELEAPAVVEHFWLIVCSHKDGVRPLQRHAVVSRTNTLVEIVTQASTLQRFGHCLRLRTQTQTIP